MSGSFENHRFKAVHLIADDASVRLHASQIVVSTFSGRAPSDVHKSQSPQRVGERRRIVNEKMVETPKEIVDHERLVTQVYLRLIFRQSSLDVLLLNLSLVRRG